MEQPKQKKQRTESQENALRERMSKLRQIQAQKREERKAKGEVTISRKKKDTAQVSL
jgi:hypothetical protein